MKSFIRLCLVLSLCLGVGVGKGYSTPTASKPTGLNLLLITIDTLRPDRLSCYSDAFVKTPNIDSLAERGVLFRQAYAHTPTTLPSHTNIFLGTTPIYHGVHDNQSFIVQEEFLTLAEFLKNHGYATGAFVGAFPLDSRFGLTQGFDVYNDHYGITSPDVLFYVERKAEAVVAAAQNWLREQNSPWFLWIHCFDPHQRYNPPEPFKTEYINQPYNGEVAYVDTALGSMFDYLNEEGLFSDTLVIFTADHGESLGEHGESTHGYFAYNSSIKVPMILVSPGIKPSESQEYVCHVDIFPTVCEILGLDKPDFLHGLSLLPATKGKKLAKRDIYFETLYPYYSRGWAPQQGVIYDQGKFFDSPIPEFYDLEKDPNELENLVTPAKIKEGKDRLAALIEKQSANGGSGAQQQKLDQRSLEKLRALGYISSPQAARKESFTAEDDLKTLLPYQNQLQDGMSAFHKGNYEQSIEILSGIIAERKDFDLAYVHLAEVYKKQRRLKEAVEVLREGYTNSPSSYKVIITFGIFLTEVAQYDAAINVLQESLDIIDYDPEAWNYLGVAYWMKGDYDKALETFNQGLELDNNHPIIFNNIGSVYLSKFQKSRAREDHRLAMHNFQKSIEFDPEYASAYNGLGAVYSYMGNIDGAIFCWEKALELKPDFAIPMYNLGLAYINKGDNAKALEALSKYKEINYQNLSAQEKSKLDALITKIQR